MATRMAGRTPRAMASGRKGSVRALGGGLPQSKQMLVVVPPHPLIKHWLAIARNEFTPSPAFRTAVAEIGKYLVYEACREWLPTVEMECKTPMGMADVEVVDHEQPVLIVPILRAGLVLMESARDVIPSSKTYHVGFVRDEKTLLPSMYLNKLPDRIDPQARVLVSDPMLATGGTIVACLDELVSRGADPNLLRIVSVVAAPPALKKISEKYQGVRVDHVRKQEVWAGVNEKAEKGEQVEESQVREIPEHDRDMRFLPVELRGIPVMAPARKNGGGDKRKREVEVLPMGQRLVVGPEEQERMEEREANQSEKVRKSLPPGWQVRAKLRRSGPSAGQAFHYSFISPDRKFRCPSFARVKAYLIEHARISREAHAANKSDGNDDHCSSCLKDGELVCCDGCPSSWHLECLEKGKEEIGSTFYCPNCVFCKQ
eukprot:scaffold649_cov347-Pavlova_lutheri.AAC.130